ncbi:MAG: tRNA lysidine(34) synthetase TilS [Alphaproteobacteria bacterium]
MIDNGKGASVDFMDAFCVSMERNFSTALDGVRAVAVGVSGGADSMALCFAMAEYFAGRGVVIHAITVDHGLRAEAADEAQHVARSLSALPNVVHHILQWDHGGKPIARVQELARKARYDLMREFMAEHLIVHLFLGHHLDDQAETFLFRLAKGSGLDGLACMPFVQDMGAGFFLCRPMIEIPKSNMVGYCAEHGIEYVNDPSNNDEAYARVRLRGSMDVLAREGLTAKRLGVSARRIGRARLALDEIAAQEFDGAVIYKKSKRVVFNFKLLILLHEEVFLRVILRAINGFCVGRDYAVRMEKAERLCYDLIHEKPFRKQTLGGVIFEVDPKAGQLILTAEE